MDLYKPCDIRGPEEELNPGLYQRWGEVLGGWLDPGSLFVVGGDVRLSTPGFSEALVRGLRGAGMRVLFLGTVPTPMVYFAQRHLHAPGAAVVTASHSPPGINGLKWMVGDLPPSEEQVARLRAEAESGQGTLARSGGSREVRCADPAYRAWLQNRWSHPDLRLRVVVDPGGGAWSGRACAYLSRVFPGVTCVALHDRVDGRFRARPPDPARPQHLQALARCVRAEGADLGVAFDGDGDRVAFADGDGHLLTAEQAAWILVQSFGAQWAGRCFAYDIKCSQRIVESVRRLGGEPVPRPSGHAFIRTAMIQRRALFGAEVSGHFFYDELAGGDDGLFTTCRMLRFLESTGKTLAQWRDACPTIFTTPDLRLPMEPSARAGALQRIRSAFQDLPQSFVDGVRIEFEGGWGLVRSSVTAPQLTFRFEGEDPDRLEHIVRTFCARAPGLGDALWNEYIGERSLSGKA